ncbi:MAG: hypothetical protein JST04_03975 [Bdellovibrionales bacterium]|nr:hypothetical protein [Bdellovibrionales bacterium]
MRIEWAFVFAAIGTASAADLPPEVLGAWNVQGFYGRSFAAYTISADGSVTTVVPRVANPASDNMTNQDMKSHWMAGGKVVSLGDGKYVFRNEKFFDSIGPWPPAQKASKEGIPFHIDSSSSPAKIVWDASPELKRFFPDNAKMTDDELAKAKAAVEPFRFETEKSPWTFSGATECQDASVAPGHAPRGGSPKLFDALTKSGPVRFARSDSALKAVFTNKEKLEATYTPSALEKSIQINSGQESLTLLDQGEVEGKPGTHRFRANVGGRCAEILATNQTATGGTASGGTASSNSNTSGSITNP